MLSSLNEVFLIELTVYLLTLFLLSQFLHLFDLKGGIGAVIIGAIVSIFGNLNWLVLLIIFAMSSQIATKYKFQEKKERKMQEGERGERRISNVVYGGAIGVTVAILNGIHLFNFPYFVAFASAFAAITSDTFASEIGIIDTKTYLITTLKRCQTGINGGISRVGTLASILGSVIISSCYGILSISGGVDIYYVLIILVSGFLGCQLDSILGALFENRKKMTKGEVNLSASLFAVFLTVLIITA